MGPVVPYTAGSARESATRPAPPAVTSVPSMSKRKRRRAAARSPVSAAPAHDARQDIEHRVDLGGGGPAAEREAERALRLLARAADGAQHVRGLAGGEVA